MGSINEDSVRGACRKWREIECRLERSARLQCHSTVWWCVGSRCVMAIVQVVLPALSIEKVRTLLFIYQPPATAHVVDRQCKLSRLCSGIGDDSNSRLVNAMLKLRDCNPQASRQLRIWQTS